MRDETQWKNESGKISCVSQLFCSGGSQKARETISMELFVFLLLLWYPIKVEILTLWLGLTKIISSIFPPVTFPASPKYFSFHLQNYSNCSEQSSCKFMRGKNLIKRMRMSHSGQPIMQPEKNLKKKKRVRKSKFNQYIFVCIKAESSMNGNFFEIPISMCLFVLFFRKLLWSGKWYLAKYGSGMC